MLWTVRTVVCAKGQYGDVDVPYPAEAHQRCPRARSRALVAHPRDDLWSVDEVRVPRKQHRRERLARSGGLFFVLV